MKKRNKNSFAFSFWVKAHLLIEDMKNMKMFELYRILQLTETLQGISQTAKKLGLSSKQPNQKLS